MKSMIRSTTLGSRASVPSYDSKPATPSKAAGKQRAVPGGARRKETVVASLAGKIDRLLALEAALSQIYDALKIPSRIDKDAVLDGRNKWLDVTEGAGKGDWSLGFGFDSRQTKVIRESLVVEAVAVALLDDYARSSFGDNVNVRNTASYILQNRRIVNDLFFENLLAVAAADDPEVKEVLLYSHPIIMHALKNFKKREAGFVLSRNNDILKKTSIVSAVRQVCSDRYRAKTYNDILKETEKVTPEQVFAKVYEEKKSASFDNRYPPMTPSGTSTGLRSAAGTRTLLPRQLGGRPRRTLVLDMDETLVHCIPQMDGGGWIILRRPGVEDFLRRVAEKWEVVVFTAGTQEYADFVLDRLDPTNLIKYRLYREHTSPRTVRMMGEEDVVYFKDMSKLGRDLRNCLIVDNTPANFDLQPDNGVPIETWFDDPSDTALAELGAWLNDLIDEDVADVREAVREQRRLGWPWEQVQQTTSISTLLSPYRRR